MKIWQAAHADRASVHATGPSSGHCRQLAAAALALLILGSAAAAPTAPRLNVVSWNLEWLADVPTLDKQGFWARCRANQFTSERFENGQPSCRTVGAVGRTAALYERNKLRPLRKRLAELADGGMDVLAVQEVASEAALMAVLPSGWRVVCSTRTEQAQNLGYAVRESAPMRLACSEFKALSLPPSPDKPGRQRRGLELVAQFGGADGPKVTILNVHLKAFCATRDMSRHSHKQSGHCATLRRQVPVLEAWIEGRADANEPFLVLGDWNRDLEREIRHGLPARTGGFNAAEPSDGQHIRHMWPELNDGQPAASAMRVVRTDRQAAAGRRCQANLDQAASSELLLSRLQEATLISGQLTGVLLPSSGVSDHCPLRVDLRW